MAAWQIIALVALGVLFIGGAVLAYFGDDAVFPYWWIAGPLALVAATLIVFVPIWNSQQQQWVDWCHSQGGHVRDHTDTTTVVTVGANGQPAVGTGSSTTYYCLTADGRILDVR